MKYCSKCQQTKSLEDFPLSTRNKNGRGSPCKICRAKRDKKMRSDRVAIVPEYKICATCRRNLPAIEFYKNRCKRDGLHAHCKQCYKDQWDKDGIRCHYKSKYGITAEEYDAMVIAQDGVCAICHRPPAEDIRLSVDHCHTTNRVRGLLCASCNLGIGQLGDDPEILLAAAAYLRSIPS